MAVVDRVREQVVPLAHRFVVRTDPDQVVGDPFGPRGVLTSEGTRACAVCEMTELRYMNQSIAAGVVLACVGPDAVPLMPQQVTRDWIVRGHLKQHGYFA